MDGHGFKLGFLSDDHKNNPYQVLSIENGEKIYSPHLAEMHQLSLQGLSSLHRGRLPKVMDCVRQRYCASSAKLEGLAAGRAVLSFPRCQDRAGGAEAAEPSPAVMMQGCVNGKQHGNVERSMRSKTQTLPKPPEQHQ